MLAGLAWAGAVAGAAAGAVAGAGWAALYAAGLLATIVLPHTRLARLGAGAWALVAAMSLLLAALFFGADFALAALGNAVKRRAPAPAWLHGVELYHVLCPGLASVAIGQAAARARHVGRR